MYASPFRNNSRGVMILINNNFEYKVERVETDPNGNFIILDIKMQDKRFTLVNLYGPNEDKPQFFNNIRQKLVHYENDLTILCGDWNLVINPDIDTYNYLHINNPSARQTVLKFKEEDNFVDIWRVFHENEKGFTWSRRNPVRKQARLDFYLISDALFPYITDTSITTGFKSDHHGILLTFKFNENERGHGYWKFNNMLLKDKDYIKLVKETIKDAKNTYLNREENVNQNVDNIPDEEIQFSISDQLFLETLLMMIRGNSIKYSSFRKRKKNEEENNLEKEIKEIENKIIANLDDISEEQLQHLDQKNLRLNEIRNEKLGGVLLRSRTRYEDLGEKPTNYFFTLENRNYTNKVITKLIDENGSEFTKTKDVLNCQKRFYENLYSDNIPVDEISIETVLGDNPNKLNRDEAEKLEGEISYFELAKALKRMKNNKTPGPDGFTVEFFKFFWIDLGRFIQRSLNFAYQSGSLSVTQKQGIITCLP